MPLLPRPLDDARRQAGVPNGAVVLALVGIWLVPGLMAGIETWMFARMGGRPFPIWRAFTGQAPAWLTYALLTPLILHLDARLPLGGRPFVPRLLTHFGFALLAGIPYALVAASVWPRFSPFPSSQPFTQLAVSWYLAGLPIMMLAYFATIGAGRAIYWFTRNRSAEVAAARLETQLAEARLGALRMQIQPHFLFNSLNAITVLVRDRENDTAERVLELLSSLLRESLRTDGAHRVPLGDELALVRRYLEVETIRFSDRLDVRYHVPRELEDALVPVMILQPLIENALRHGIGRRSDAGILDIAACIGADGRLELSVRDDGPGPGMDTAHGPDRGAREGTTPSQGGIGLENVRQRLAVLYDGDAGVSLAPADGRGAIARVTIPLERAAVASIAGDGV